MANANSNSLSEEMKVEEIGKAKKVGDLIKLLQKIDEECGWYGWDDGCIIITSPEFPHDDIGYIQNEE